MPSNLHRLTICLGVSILINCFLGGLYLGERLMPGPRPAGGGGFAPAERIRQLPAADRAAFAAAMAPHRPAIKAARQRTREARAKVEADIAAPLLDRDALTGDLAAFRSASAEQQRLVHEALVDALSRVSPAARTRLFSPSRGSGLQVVSPVLGGTP